ncbi:MAG: cytochrome c3 family protein [Chloroflexi bacterium]|nr:cytochrome c3 family protein [Chloroflexota bacterium]
MKNRRLLHTSLPITLVVAISLTFIIVGTVLADNGPHGGYTATTDACAGCHRAHTAPAARLLLDTTPDLCYTCHGNTGTGADTNVMSGVYLDRDIDAETPPEGIANQGLKGGGFQSALMDTDAITLTAATIISTTSNHLDDGSQGTAWGSGALTSTLYAGRADFSLSCVSCHDPHGSDTYRILRPIPTDSGAGAPIVVSDQVTKTYTVVDSANDYMSENYGTIGSSLASWCSQCHTRYLAGSGSGHTDSGDAIFTYRHSTTNVSCVRCHVAHGSTATMGLYSGSVLWPDTANAPNGDARSSLLRLDNRGVCADCHLADDGTISGGACDSCHGAPPPTGAHIAHTGAGAVGYDLIGSLATDTDYAYGCGECHPTDFSQHQNGIVEVDLASGSALPGSIKAMNAATASFAGGSCSGVYCHSALQVASGPVGLPLDDGGGNYIFDEHMNLTYDPYTITETRVFLGTPAWNGGQITTCTACHEFPLTTSYPSVEAGVGNSHQWIGADGFGNLHAWNMGFDPLSCRTCHYGEVTEANTWTRVGDASFYDPVPLASRVVHANGEYDVAFDTINDAVYDGWSGLTVHELDGAAYDPIEKACTNVGCHLEQNYVQWGTPYRWETNECDLCHRYGLPSPPPLAMANNLTELARSSIHPPTPGLTNRSCTSCHTTRSHDGG